MSSPLSTLASRCNNGNQTREAGPGSVIITSMKSFKLTREFYNVKVIRGYRCLGA